jgi:hypothetical protein
MVGPFAVSSETLSRISKVGSSKMQICFVMVKDTSKLLFRLKLNDY